MPGHTVSRSTYYLVSVALAVLLAATVLASYVDVGRLLAGTRLAEHFDFGWLNVFIAMAIATAKAVLIMLFFMHLKYSPPLVRLVAVSGFVWLGILLVITMADYVARGWW